MPEVIIEKKIRDNLALRVLKEGKIQLQAREKKFKVAGEEAELWSDWKTIRKFRCKAGKEEECIDLIKKELEKKEEE